MKTKTKFVEENVYLSAALNSLSSFDACELAFLLVNELKNNINDYRKDVDSHNSTKYLLDLLHKISTIYVNLIQQEAKGENKNEG